MFAPEFIWATQDMVSVAGWLILKSP